MTARDAAKGVALGGEAMQGMNARAFAKCLLIGGTFAAILVGTLPARADDTLKVAIGQINNWENQMPTLGQDVGIFKKYGLILDNFGTAGAGETMQPIIAGSADVGIGVGVAGVMRVFSKGAPVRILLPAFTGTSDLYWYVKAESPLKKLTDTTEKNTIAYSTSGSSSNNIVVGFVDTLGVKAKPTATGTPAATLTAVMSGQVDIGWGAFPVGLKEVEEGKVRIIARGSDVASLDKQTVRVVIVNAETLKSRKDVLMRFVKAYRETVDWMYAGPDAIKRYAAKVGSPEDFVARSIPQIYPKATLQTDEMKDMEGIQRDAVKLKFLDQPLTQQQLGELLQIPPKS
jgi:NitT/TauT family transport system substrate-binding protein